MNGIFKVADVIHDGYLEKLEDDWRAHIRVKDDGAYTGSNINGVVDEFKINKRILNSAGQCFFHFSLRIIRNREPINT